MNDTQTDVFDAVSPDAPQKDAFDSIEHTRLVMCKPTYLSTDVKNNVFMSGEKVDVTRAVIQWSRTVHILKALDADVLEIPPTKGAQDAIYTANVAVAIKPYVILARYKAPGRAVEIPAAKKFFEDLGYQTVQPPDFFEGEADLKKWKDGVYFGGVGQFSTQAAFDWIQQQTGVTIIPLREVNPEQFHLDCSLTIVDEENFIVAKSGLDAQSVATLEKYGNVIFTPENLGTTGITNGILVPEKKIYLSGTFNPELGDYRKSMEWLLTTMDKLGYAVVFCDVDEYNASGADLSCSVMRLDFTP